MGVVSFTALQNPFQPANSTGTISAALLKVSGSPSISGGVCYITVSGTVGPLIHPINGNPTTVANPIEQTLFIDYDISLTVPGNYIIGSLVVFYEFGTNISTSQFLDIFISVIDRRLVMSVGNVTIQAGTTINHNMLVDTLGDGYIPCGTSNEVLFISVTVPQNSGLALNISHILPTPDVVQSYLFTQIDATAAIPGTYPVTIIVDPECGYCGGQQTLNFTITVTGYPANNPAPFCSLCPPIQIPAQACPPCPQLAAGPIDYMISGTIETTSVNSIATGLFDIQRLNCIAAVQIVATTQSAIVTTIANIPMNYEGTWNVSFDTSGVPPGSYIVRFTFVSCGVTKIRDVVVNVPAGIFPNQVLLYNGQINPNIPIISVPTADPITVVDNTGCVRVLPAAPPTTGTPNTVTMSNKFIQIGNPGSPVPYTYKWETIAGVTTFETPSTKAIVDAKGSGIVALTTTDGWPLSDTDYAIIIDPVRPNVVINHVSCFGGSDGEICIDPKGGIGPYSIQWGKGDIEMTHPYNTMCISGLTPGEYWVRIKDHFNSLFIGDRVQYFLITEPDEIAVTFRKSDILCRAIGSGENCTGFIEVVDIRNTHGAIGYHWSLPDGSKFSVDKCIYNICEGDYIFNVIDSNGCVKSFPICLTAPTAIEIDIQVEAVTCDCNDGRVTFTFNGGKEPFQYYVDGRCDSQNHCYLKRTVFFNNLSAGRHTLEVIDGNGCHHKVEFIIPDSKIYVE